MPIPANIHLHKHSQTLELSYSDGQCFTLPAELLRISSPSAEVRGHGQPILQTGKKYVGISNLQAVGNYAIQIIFNDGHDTGIYSWEYLHDLGLNKDQHWANYLHLLDNAGQSRDPDEQPLIFKV